MFSHARRSVPTSRNRSKQGPIFARESLKFWAQIAALRKELASRTQSFTEHDRLAVPDEDLPVVQHPQAAHRRNPAKLQNPPHQRNLSVARYSSRLGVPRM